MSPNQKRCLDVVAGWLEKHGVSPTYREITKALGSNSPSHAYGVIDALIAQGELVRTAARCRNLALPGIDLSNVSTEALRAELQKREA